MEIEKIIKSKLSEIEENRNVKILYAVESGSRAWGFASDDSDYDVRFIYVRPGEEYLKLEKIRDVIDYELNDVYDINGWDLKKFLTLLHDSNPVIFEWAQSPIVYKSTDEWNKISSIINDFAQLKKLLYHYLSMSKNHYNQFFRTEEVSYKKYFYILRALLCCQWIFKKNSIPPILFDDLVKVLFVKKSVFTLLDDICKTSTKFFARPNSPLKEFSGRILDKTDLIPAHFDYGFYHEDINLPIVLSELKSIEKEYCFVCVKDSIVTGCEYLADGRKGTLLINQNDEAWTFAQKIACEKKQKDFAYIIDICQSEGDLFLLEMNPFSGADLYVCDAEKIINAIESVG